MEQTSNELLLKDLCSRLPYGVKVQMSDGAIEELLNVNVSTFICNGLKGLPKPYLFPLSSMTEEQFHELKEITDFKYNRNNLELVEWTKTHKTIEFWLEEVPQYKVVEVFDWLNKNHFDYRCLIERGLAIDATGLNIY